MNSETLFEAFGWANEEFVAQAAERRQHKRPGFTPTPVTLSKKHPQSITPALSKQEHSTPAETGTWLRWVIPAAWLAVAVLTLAILPRFQSSQQPLVTPDLTDAPTFDLSQTPQTTILEVPEPTVEAIPYELEFTSVEDFYALQNAYSLSDDALVAFLEEKGYATGGIEDREDLSRFLLDAGFTPVPSLGAETPKYFMVKEYDLSITFEFTNLTIEVRKLADPDYVETQTRQLSLIWQYEAYPLYHAAEAQTADGIWVTMKLNAQEHLVTIRALAESQEEAIAMLEGLTFRFPETGGQANIPAGIHMGDAGDWATWRFAESTGVLTLSPKVQGADCGGYLVAEEVPWMPYADQITAVTVAHGIDALGPRTITGLVNLQSVSLPGTLKHVGEENFSGCGITALVLPESVTSVGVGVASNCPDLREVSLLAQTPAVEADFLADCPSLSQISFGGSTGYWQLMVLNKNAHLEELEVLCTKQSPSAIQETQPPPESTSTPSEAKTSGPVKRISVPWWVFLLAEALAAIVLYEILKGRKRPED